LPRALNNFLFLFQQIQTQIQLQAQALVHAHTQAQKSAGIFKGEAPTSSAPAPAPAPPKRAAPAPVPSRMDDTPMTDTSVSMDTSDSSNKVPNPVPMLGVPHPMPMDVSSTSIVPQAPAPSSSSPQFLAQLNASLNKFWKDQLQVVQAYSQQTEQDFKTHNDLPLARIKRIMKSDEDVRMISAEAPVLFAKACELFILDLSIRSWNYSQLHKRRTLQKEDIREAIQKTDIFDFLVDVI
jgi:nuclear transcription factor Y gamma